MKAEEADAHGTTIIPKGKSAKFSWLSTDGGPGFPWGEAVVLGWGANKS